MNSENRNDADQREYPRHNVSCKGIIFAEEDRIEIHCEIKNLSREGALLRFEEPVDLPPWFELILENTQKQIKGRTVWEDSELAGVRFYSNWKDYEPNDEHNWILENLVKLQSWIKF